MAWFRKKADPISDRARALNQEIAELEAKIKRLDGRLQGSPSGPRLRSTAVPHAQTLTYTSPASPEPPPVNHEPIFEEVDRNRWNPADEGASTPELFNELGVRKYDLPALVRRLRDHFRGPSTTNPNLVSYLAAGGIQGLRPIRYEKRVARKRFIALVAFLFLMLLGFILVFLKRKV